MENQKNCMCAELHYPCLWHYKIIGTDSDQIRAAIAEVIQGAECHISHSNSSNTGRYHCLNLELIVSSEETRNQIFQSLKSNPNVKMVL